MMKSDQIRKMWWKGSRKLSIRIDGRNWHSNIEIWSCYGGDKFQHELFMIIEFERFFPFSNSSNHSDHMRVIMICKFYEIWSMYNVILPKPCLHYIPSWGLRVRWYGVENAITRLKLVPFAIHDSDCKYSMIVSAKTLPGDLRPKRCCNWRET